MEHKKTEPVNDPASGQILIYQDGALNLQVRLDGETVWLSRIQIAELFQTTPQNITLHIAGIYEEGELAQEATSKEYLLVQTEGARQVRRTLKHYNLNMILAVGYRVRSQRGTQFRQWATARLSELLVKGFTLDDERIKAGRTLGQDYFDELLARIRDIRSSERLFYQKITDIYSTSIDYDRNAQMTEVFFKTVQNKMHWAAHGHTAAEVVRRRADSRKPHMGLTTWKNAPLGPVRKADVAIAKNYLDKDELEQLNLIVSAYLDFAELQARSRKPMYMRDWITKLDAFLRLSERNVLTSAGKISHALAEEHARAQFAQYEEQRRQLATSQPVSDFDRTVEQIKQLGAPRPTRVRKGKNPADGKELGDGE
ncbi:MAG TPA: virulence RhuM family protein [Terracidiphilus sp.]|nr:virulence RhuM family protein [Terracidiphilus sp.]